MPGQGLRKRGKNKKIFNSRPNLSQPIRALLINPWIHDFAAYDLWSKPLGLLKIASCLKQLGVEVSLIDCLDRFHPRLIKFLNGKLPKSTVYGNGHYYTQPIEKPAVFKSIPRTFKRYGLPKELFQQIIVKESPPDIILVTSGMTYWYPGVFEAIGILKQQFGSVPILLGGIYAKLCFKHAKDYSGADFVYNGNGIQEVIKLINGLIAADFDYSAIDNQEYIFPAYELYPKLNYITLRTSSGCPFKCTYCGWYILEEGFKQKEPESVVSQIEYFYKRGIRTFSFYDDALLYNAERHIIKILKELIKKRINARFHTPNGLHIQFISPELAKLFKQAGFIQPRLGLETASAKRQLETGAKVTNKQFLKAVKYLENAGYAPGDLAVNIMIGLPGQDLREIRDSIGFVARTGCKIFLEEYSPVPNTPDYLKSGLSLDCDPLFHNNSAFPVYRGDYWKFQELKDLAHSKN